MGLNIEARGCETSYHSGYMGWGWLCGEIVHTFFGAEMADTFNIRYTKGMLRRLNGEDIYTDEEFAFMQPLIRSTIRTLVFHSDCGGCLSVKQCRKIYRELLKKPQLEFSEGWCPEIKAQIQGWYDDLIAVLRHCATRGVIARFW